MAVSPLELLQRQAESAVRREVSRQTAQVRRQLSLVDQVRQMSRRAEQTLDGAARSAAARLTGADEAQRPAGDLAPDDAPEQKGPVVCADGYVRRSPVQRYRRPKNRRWLRRAVGVALLAVLAVLLAMALWRSGLIRMRLF